MRKFIYSLLLILIALVSYGQEEHQAELIPAGGGKFPLITDVYLKGGLRSVATLADRDAIPSLRRSTDMFVYVSANSVLYQLNSDLNTWRVSSVGGSINQPKVDSSVNSLLGKANEWIKPQTFNQNVVYNGYVSFQNGAAANKLNSPYYAIGGSRYYTPSSNFTLLESDKFSWHVVKPQANNLHITGISPVGYLGVYTITNIDTVNNYDIIIDATSRVKTKTGAAITLPARYSATFYSKLLGTDTIPCLVQIGEVSQQNGVPITRTITINGVTFDLSQNRSWSITAGVSKFNNRTGDILPQAGDYSSFYPSITGAYSDPSWISSLSQSKIVYTGSLSQYIRGDGSLSTFPVLKITNKNMTALVTTGNGQLACSTGISTTPVNGGYVAVYLNGLLVNTGDGVKTTEAYFSGDNGTTARSLSAIQAGDKLYWNGNIANRDLDTNDNISFLYI